MVLATANCGKIVELRALIQPYPFRLLSLPDLWPRPPMPEETGRTYEANAVIKARAIASDTGFLTLADDSGLEVDCLQGRPGVWSSRYGRTDEERVGRLLQEVGNRRPAGARFVCVVAIARPDGGTKTFEGECRGMIVATPYGDGGFGFDPVFVPDEGSGETMAQLSRDEKNRISHRARAVARAMSWLVSSEGGAWVDETLFSFSSPRGTLR